MSQAIIEIKGLNFSYDHTPVLKNIDLTVRERDFLALLGPNGGGKTTLIKIMLGLLTPKSGKVSIFGKDPACYAQYIGYLPQHFSISPDFPITVLEVVLMGLTKFQKLGWRFSREEKERAEAAMQRVEILEYAHKPIQDLSGGQRQRVLIARALVADPRLLILDEPTSNIDPQGKFCFYEFLAELSQSITILVVSHDLSITAAQINSIACINKELIHNPRPELTEDMFKLLYGVHERHSCPLTEYHSSRFPFICDLRPRQ